VRDAVVPALSFRPLAREGFPLLAAWLSEPLVDRWWHDEVAPEALERDYGPAVDGREPTEVFLALADGEPSGLVQRYPLAAYPEDLAELLAVLPVPPRVPAGALSIDYLIGEPTRRGRGLGAAVVAAFVEATWADHPEASDVVVPVATGSTARRGRGLGAAVVAAFVEATWADHPEASDVVVPVATGNTASWRTLERAGFTRVAEGEMEPDNPRDPRDHVVYHCARPARPAPLTPPSRRGCHHRVMDVTVEDDGQDRYVATTGDGEVVGFAVYERDGDRIVFPHTVVEPEHQDQGVGSALATAALDDARARGLTVVPACAFFSAFLADHDEYADLVAEG